MDVLLNGFCQMALLPNEKRPAVEKKQVGHRGYFKRGSFSPKEGIASLFISFCRLVGSQAMCIRKKETKSVNSIKEVKITAVPAKENVSNTQVFPPSSQFQLLSSNETQVTRQQDDSLRSLNPEVKDAKRAGEIEKRGAVSAKKRKDYKTFNVEEMSNFDKTITQAQETEADAVEKPEKTPSLLKRNKFFANSVFLNRIRREVVRARRDALTNLGSSSKTVVAAVRAGLTDEQIVAVPSVLALQRQLQRSRQPVGASSVDKAVDQVVWLDFFRETEQAYPL
uniref:Uncharacterized protein n=1 Tax=Ditylenchus dipsaci TaxID=166011 RepID=A0A915EPB8_9BILA